ncbi:MAG: heparinase II/III family protein [Bacteroidota bacterium]
MTQSARKVGIGIILFAQTSFLFNMAYTQNKLRYYHRYYLSASATETELSEWLGDLSHWQPFPGYQNRTSWEALNDSIKLSLSVLGQQKVDYSWPSIPAQSYLEYMREGNRNPYQEVSFERRQALMDLVLAEMVEGEGKYMDQIVNGIWSICEESFWGVPAHLFMQKIGTDLADTEDPVVDLFAAETAALLAWTDYLLGPELDSISPVIRKRMADETDKRILTPLLETDDYWWMGFAPKDNYLNNWNPWINSNWILATLVFEKNEFRRSKALHKSLRSLDEFLNEYAKDGGCDEGPNYWSRAGASLFDCLELLYGASQGKIDIYGKPVVGEMARYIYRAHIADKYYINFADTHGKLRVNSELIYRFGKRIKDEDMMAFAAYTYQLQKNFTPGSIGRKLHEIFNFEELASAEAKAPYLKDVWLEETEVMLARSEAGSTKGFFLAAMGAHNDQSHNHNDVGNFIIYLEGKPVLIDLGVETYSRKTFSKDRYEIWTMQSGFHNLPTIGGVMQEWGLKRKATNVNYFHSDSIVNISMNIEEAYPDSAGLKSWERSINFDRKKDEIRLTEAYELQKKGPDIVLSFMSAAKVRIEGGNILFYPGGDFYAPSKVLMEFDPKKFEARSEKIEIKDPRLREIWGEAVYRVLLSIPKPKMRDSWDIYFRIDKAK